MHSLESRQEREFEPDSFVACGWIFLSHNGGYLATAGINTGVPPIVCGNDHITSSPAFLPPIRA